MNRKVMKFLPGIISISLVLVFWWLLSVFGGLPQTFFPSPFTVLTVLISDLSRLLNQLGTTLWLTLIGFSFSLTSALFLGYLIIRVPLLDRFFQPFYLLSQTIPTITLAPLLITWLGFGPEPRVAIVVISCAFPILIAFLQGLKSTEKLYIDLLRSLGASGNQIFWKVQFPSSLGSLFAGVRIAAVYGILAMVMSEWMGGQEGIGVYMLRSFKSFQTAQVFAAIFLVSFTSLALYSSVSQIEKSVIKWRPKESL